MDPWIFLERDCPTLFHVHVFLNGFSAIPIQFLHGKKRICAFILTRNVDANIAEVTHGVGGLISRPRGISYVQATFFVGEKFFLLVFFLPFSFFSWLFLFVLSVDFILSEVVIRGG